MHSSLNIISTVLLLGAVQGLFLASLLFNKQGNRTADRILASLMIFYSAFITGSAFSGMELYSNFPHLLDVFIAIPFLLGPLHYLYAKFLSTPNLKFTKQQWLHFIPFLIYRVYVIPYHFQTAEYKLDFMQNMALNGKPLMLNIFTWAVDLQGITYMVLTLLLLKQYSTKIKDNYLSIDQINLNWLRNITIMSACVWVVVVVFHFLRRIGYEPFQHVDIHISEATIILIYAMGYLGLRQPGIFSRVSITATSTGQLHTSQLSGLEKNIFPQLIKKPGTGEFSGEHEELISNRKYQKSGLSSEKAKEYLQNLLDIMNDEKPFTNSNLNLHDLSEKLSISSHNLSEVINTRLKKSFFDFVNQYRIEEVKMKMADPKTQHYTVLSIALDAGFNSKSSFNTIFKKQTNMTPSQYREFIARPNS